MLYDKDIRPPLFDLLEENAGFFGGRVRILEEVTTGRARADAVMVTPGLLYGIEIKSDADTYARLDGQVKNYDWYYDRNIIVVGTSHAQHVMEHVPGWWGIITVEEVDGAVDLYVLRRTQPNPKVKDHRKMTILWRPELARILEKIICRAIGRRAKNMSRKNCSSACRGISYGPRYAKNCSRGITIRSGRRSSSIRGDIAG